MTRPEIDLPLINLLRRRSPRRSQRIRRQIHQTRRPRRRQLRHTFKRRNIRLKSLHKRRQRSLRNHTKRGIRITRRQHPTILRQLLLRSSRLLIRRIRSQLIQTSRRNDLERVVMLRQQPIKQRLIDTRSNRDQLLNLTLNLPIQIHVIQIPNNRHHTSTVIHLNHRQLFREIPRRRHRNVIPKLVIKEPDRLPILKKHQPILRKIIRHTVVIQSQTTTRRPTTQHSLVRPIQRSADKRRSVSMPIRQRRPMNRHLTGLHVIRIPSTPRARKILLRPLRTIPINKKTLRKRIHH